MAATDAELMDMALDAAARADWGTSPNPMVGAVVARGGEVVAVGYHRAAGLAHAEVDALTIAGDAAPASDLFVTLEPCTVHGRTPPCVDAIVASRPRRVVVAMLDPNPAVAGAGVAALRAAGIEVEVGLRQRQAEHLNRFYATWMRTALPHVTVKFAASLDGRIATRTGESQWISSPEARELGHVLRHRHDAVMVGAGTAVADDPALTDRRADANRQPLRVVVDTTLRMPPTSRVFAAGERPALVATTAAAPAARVALLEAAGAEVLVLPDRAGQVDLAALLAELGRRQCISLLVEGGATLLGAVLDQQLADSVVAVISPLLVGGRDAPAAVAGLGAATLAEATRLADIEVSRAGGDVIVTGYCVR